ncbi:complement component [Lithospermum erythrorhizon]|uniref:Complement component n=1 Tax=Lithospermum erythrorhizon TaxID=34254 RepID=A0AAV3P096_LITER
MAANWLLRRVYSSAATLPPRYFRYTHCAAAVSFSTAVSGKKKKEKWSDNDSVIELIDSEIKSPLRPQLLHHDVDVPVGFPFKIHDGPGRRTIVLERDYHGETTIVIVDFSKAGYEENVGSEKGCRDHDGKNEPEFSLPMVVSISKGDPLVLQFEVRVFPDKMSIYGIRTVQPSETSQAYEGPAFLDLNSDLQEAFHKYLEARGLTSCTAKFLLEYVIVKDAREYLRWLKKLKICLSI